MFPFGHGLSYTSVTYSELAVKGRETVTVTFKVRNTGDRAGADVPQLYLTDALDGPRLRLLAFERVELEPSASHSVSLTTDPLLLAGFDLEAGGWRIVEGAHRVAVGPNAEDRVIEADASLTGRLFGS
jgi:beta-glucosidase